MSENKKRIIIIAAVAAVCVGLYFGGQAVVDHAQAAQQAELDAYQAEQQAQLEAARKAEEEAAAKVAKITLAPIPSNNVTATTPGQDGSSQETPKPMPSATITTGPDGSITIIPDFEAEAAAASQLQKPGEKVDANISGGGGDLPLGKDGAYHGDHPAQGSSQETPKPTASTASTGSPEASTKPSEVTQKPTASQTPTTTPAPTPAATVEPPAASQKPSGGDSGSEDKPEVTPEPSQSQDPGSSDTPPSGTGYNGEIRGEWGWLDGFGWVERGGSNGGTGGQIDDSDRGWGWGEMGETVGNM